MTSILTTAINLERGMQELHRALVHGKQAREKRYRLRKLQEDKDRRYRTAEALERETKGGPRVAEEAQG